jgi:hypothetical protein
MNNLEKDILELTSEDDYGSWELWWRVSQLHKDENESQFIGSFVEALENMISRGTLKAKRKTPSGKLRSVEFSAAELRREIEKAKTPNPNQFYWFGL